MTSFIKNQILKHLTKYAKNLSPEKIKINAFKGEGDVFNLELDENKLTELLELPSWLKIKRAACNKVSIKVQWTLIKRQPIILVLDDVIISVEALDTPRKPNKSKDSFSQGPNTYGFIDRVIDGMIIKINLVRIFFTAKAFKASMELTRVSVSSKMPNWSDADHLKKTRIKSVSQGCVLLFKEIEWDSTRIEASGLQDCQATPVKLITNASKVRLTMKKSLIDQSIIESKAEFILIDLFWVLTISQIKAAILFTESLKEIIIQSNEMNKEAAKIRLETNRNVSGRSEMQTVDNSTNWSFTNITINRQKLFQKYNLKETSYHILVSRVEFHFCEEGDQSSSLSKNSVVNGSVKFLLTNSQIDLYPYHTANMTRDHFPNYKEIQRMRDIWVSNIYDKKTNTDDKNQMESVTLVRFNDISMHCVSTVQKTNNCLFISSDIIRHKLPEKTTTFFLDMTNHYWRSGSSQSLPETTIYCQINPLNLNLDWPTILWLNAFQLNLKNELKSSQYTSGSFINSQELSNNQKTPAIHIEAIMPRITLAPDKAVEGQPDRPGQIQIQVGTLSIDNVCQTSGDSDLINQVFQEYQKSTFFNGHTDFLLGISGSKTISNKTISNKSSKNSKINDKSLWKICFDPIWIDFEGAKSYNNKPKPLLESLHLTLWLSIPLNPNSNIGVVCKLRDRLEIRFDHYQLLVVYRVMDSVSSALSQMQEDEKFYTNNVDTQADNNTITIIMQIEKTSIRIEWPVSPVIVNSVTNSSSPLNLKLGNNNEEDISEKSDFQVYKINKPVFELEPLNFDHSHFSLEKTKLQNSCVHSKQNSPINYSPVIIDGSPILQPNRRSYTSLMAINHQIPSGKSIPSSSTNLLTYKSVRNLFSIGKISRRGSQNSLNTSDADKMSIDSDTSDWISEGVMNELEIGEDVLNDSINGISFATNGLIESNTTSQSCINWATFEISDFKWLIVIGNTSYANFGIFGNVIISESQRNDNFNKAQYESTFTDDTNDAKILGKIDYPNENSSFMEIRIMKEMEHSILMSTLVSIGEIFEDEIPPSVKYSDTILPPTLKIIMVSKLIIELVEDRSCNSLSCPNEHPPTFIKFPPGTSIIIDGATVISFEFVQSSIEKLTNGPVCCHKCSQSIPNLSIQNFHNSSSSNHIMNSHEHIKYERNPSKSKDSNSAHYQMILQLQHQNKMYQDEIRNLRQELQSLLKNQNDLRNLIESPSTHFL